MKGVDFRMLRIALTGFGRTGRVVADEIYRQKDVALVAVFKKHDDEYAGKDIGKIFANKPSGTYVHLISELPDFLAREDIDVMIDFSCPEAVVDYLPAVAKRRVNIVICSTNFTKAQQEQINKFSDRIGIVWAPNVTEGINILISLGKIVKSIWPDADTEILEYHFSRKKDISKTALKIAEAIADADSIKKRRKKTSPASEKRRLFIQLEWVGLSGNIPSS